MVAPNKHVHIDAHEVADRYRSGETIKEIAQSLHCHRCVIERRLKDAGITIPKSWSPPNMEEFIRLYADGMTEVQMGKLYGIARTAIHRVLEDAGIPLRSQTETNRLLMAKRTKEENRRNAEAANNAVRGVKHTFEQQCNIALGNERSPHNVSPAEDLLKVWLQESGIVAIPQKAIGPYNADLAFETIAVEILGGGYHTSGHHAARAADRTRYVLDQGWNLVFIWVDRSKRIRNLGHGAADYLISFLKETRSDPTIRGQYRVIWGCGEEVSPTSPYFYKATFIPTSSTPDSLGS
jgi:very-short-patch-repair endonuclease